MITELSKKEIEDLIKSLNAKEYKDEYDLDNLEMLESLLKVELYSKYKNKSYDFFIIPVKRIKIHDKYGFLIGQVFDKIR